MIRCPTLAGLVAVAIAPIPATPAGAQDLRSDLRAMAASVRELDPFTVKVTITALDSAGGLLLERRIVAHRLEERFLYSMDSLTILSTSHATIVVNRARHTIGYTRIDGRARAASALALPSPDSLLSGVDSVIFLAADSTGKRYRVHGWRGPVAVSELLLNPVTLLPIEVRYGYPRGVSDVGSVVIRYEWFNHLVTPRTDLEERWYVVGNGDRLRPAASFSGYELVTLSPE